MFMLAAKQILGKFSSRLPWRQPGQTQLFHMIGFLIGLMIRLMLSSKVRHLSHVHCWMQVILEVAGLAQTELYQKSMR